MDVKGKITIGDEYKESTLYWLDVYGSLSSRQLQKITNLYLEQISRTLKYLIRDKYVKLYLDPRNKNIRLYALTQKGKRYIRQSNNGDSDTASWNKMNHKDAMINFVLKNKLKIDEDILSERQIIKNFWDLKNPETKDMDLKTKMSEYNKFFKCRPDFLSINDLILEYKNEKIELYKNTAIEIETTFKNKKSYEKIIANYLELIANKKYKRVAYFCNKETYHKLNNLFNNEKIIKPFWLEIYELDDLEINNETRQQTN